MGFISGTPDDDVIHGTSGADTINGFDGHDRLFGEGGNDTLNGWRGDDRLDGGSGADKMNGGPGNDIFIVDDPGDQIFDIGNSGIDTVEVPFAYTLPKHNLDPYAGASVDNTPALENLTLTGSAAINGTGNAVANIIIGNGAANLLSGKEGNDTLAGGLGNDVLRGDAGDDLLRVAGTGSDAAHGGDGNDLLVLDYGNATAAIVRAVEADGDYDSAGTFRDAAGARKTSYTGIERLEVTTGSGKDDLVGGDGSDILRSGAGADKVNGGAGDDIVEGGAGDDILAGGIGTDTVSYASAGAAVTVSLGTGSQDTGGAGVDGLREFENIVGSVHADTLTGTDGANALSGGSGDDVLQGASGNDRLDGGAGADTMTGGSGNDNYVVDQAGDKVIEAAAGGRDTVHSAVGWRLGNHFEQLVLTGDAAINGTGNASANSLTGNTAGNRLYGLGGNDTLDGAAGADTMAGGIGNDIYVVDQAGDALIEAAGEGKDTVRSAVNWTLATDFENVVLTGATAIRATGNARANSLTGNTASNALNGLGGDDILDGAAGADTMAGGIGNDSYVVDNAGDQVVEVEGEGVDVVRASVSFTLVDNVENLVLTGRAHLSGTGNALANAISGNSGRNALDGGAGADTMSGGSGNDSYVVDHAGDSIVELAGGGTDTVLSAISHSLGAEVEHLTLTGSAAVNGTGNSRSNSLTGNVAANQLDGGAGADTMSGQAGNDTLKGGLGNDRLFGGSGNDVLQGDGGADGFYFDAALDGSTNVDGLTGFAPADDTIFLDRSIFSGIAESGALSPAAFRAGNTAMEASDRILYDSATGNIFYDADGIGAAAAILFAQVSPGTALTYSDFSAYLPG